MPKDDKTLPDESLRVLVRQADRLQRLNPHVPVSHQISARLRTAQMSIWRRARSRGAQIYLVSVLGTFAALLYWLGT